MLVLRQSLQTCGYYGACEDDQILAWAIRTGACSEFFNDLVTWLEDQLRTVRFTTMVWANIRNLFSQMRSSVLMKPHVAAVETVLNPKEYRLQSLKILVHQLELSRTKMPPIHDVEDCSTRDQQDQLYAYNDLRVILDKRSYGGGWNERLVRYNPNLLKMYE